MKEETKNTTNVCVNKKKKSDVTVVEKYTQKVILTDGIKALFVNPKDLKCS